AFKKGEFDVFICYSSKAWAKDMTGDKFDKLGWISKELWPHSNNQGGQGFFFNLRRKIFQDLRVRKAIALAFDFAWTNETLFYGQYIENKSFFANSPLRAPALPDAKQQAILRDLAQRYPSEVPAEVFTQPMGGLGQGLALKERLKLALALLKEAGYQLKD